MVLVMEMSNPDRNDREEQFDGDVAVEEEQKLRRPRLYRVLLHNDDYTTMEFVVQILMDIFNHPREAAMRIMFKVHHEGIGVAGVFTHEIAETKIHQVSDLAKQNEFPLRCSMEPA